MRRRWAVWLLALAAGGLGVACAADDDDEPDGVPDAGAWRALADAPDDAWLLSAWGTGAGDVWFAGGSHDAPVVLHWDGTAATPAPIEGDAPLWWVWGSGDGVIFVVGEGASLFRSTDDGASFVRQVSPLVDATYWGVWGADANDVWVVGEQDRPDLTRRGVLLRSVDGGPFEEVAPFAEPTRALFKVWGAAADDVWVVGELGTLLHWDGVSWSRENAGTNVRLFTVSGCSADDVWIVGGFGNGVVLHLEGGEWADVSPLYAPPINGVFCGPGVVWVVGMQGYAARRTDDGWDEFTATPLDLHGVWAAGADDAFAVGGNLNGGGAQRRGALVRWED
jgi:hypothetical protein